MAVIQIEQEYGWVLFLCVLIGLHMWCEGFIIMSKRKKLFDKKFFETHFTELKGNIPEGGYPDMGEGRYSNKLSLVDWMSFQSHQRVHGNYFEGVASIFTFLLISGLFYPIYAAVLGVVYLFGRVCYGIGYRTWGSRGRIFGAIFIDIVIVLALIGACHGAYTLTLGSSLESDAVLAIAAAVRASAASAKAATSDLAPFHQLTAVDIHHGTVDFAAFVGKVVLVVNVASNCGYTYQYAGLESLAREFPNELVILGFPSNQFGKQEPGSDMEIKQFCTSKYDVTFTMMAKIDVNGRDESPVYTLLKESLNAGRPIKWNFEKFIVDKKGKVQAHFISTVKPEEMRDTIRRFIEA